MNKKEQTDLAEYIHSFDTFLYDNYSTGMADSGV
jgi:hypothetical protein